MPVPSSEQQAADSGYLSRIEGLPTVEGEFPVNFSIAVEDATTNAYDQAVDEGFATVSEGAWKGQRIFAPVPPISEFELDKWVRHQAAVQLEGILDGYGYDRDGNLYLFNAAQLEPVGEKAAPETPGKASSGPDEAPPPAEAAPGPTPTPSPAGGAFPGPAPQPGARVYEHPQGARIYVNPDGSMEAYSATGKKKKTSATPEKLAAGHGAWTEVAETPAAPAPTPGAAGLTETPAFQPGDTVRKGGGKQIWHVTAVSEVPWGGDPAKNPHTVVYSLSKTPGGKPGNAGYTAGELTRVDTPAQLTETPDTAVAAAKVLAPTNVSEPETKSVKVPAAGRRIPMEFKEAPVAEIEKYIADPDYFFQQKVDGIRGQLVLEPGKAPWFRSKSGDRLQNPTATKITDPLVKAFGGGLPAGTPGMTVDGELLDGKWYVFDMTVNGQEQTPWSERMAAAEGWVSSLNAQGLSQVTALPTARTPAEKRALFDAVKANGGEGVMMKRRGAKYKFGSRTDEILKAKITTTADTVVMERNQGGKDNAVVGVYRNGKLERVANVSTIGKGDPKVGDVLEVEYLWAHPESGLLTQARIKKARPDKNPNMVTDSQFRFVNKEVLGPDATVPAGPVQAAA